MGIRFYIVLCCFLVVAVCLALGACAVFNQPRFGKLPQGNRHDRIQGSPNYEMGKFQNLIQTPKFSKDVGWVSLIWSGFFDKNERLVPDSPVSAVKTDLKSLSPEADTVVWLGHSAWYIQANGRRIFFSGDSGYGPHFADIGKTFHGFDLVLLDCGQYDPRWAYIHMTPEEAAQATRDLGARALIPVHVGRFTIANHPWDESFKRLAKASQDKSYRLLTPRIGEPVALNDTFSHFFSWWEAEAVYP